MRRTRNGYTLMEIVLVMAILLIVAAVAIPTMTSMFTTYNLDAAQDTVQAELTKCRNKAKEDGCSYKFAIKNVNGTGSYRIAPDSDEYWGGGSSSSGNSNSAGPEGKVVEGNLPEKVCFSPSQGVSNSGGSSTDWNTVATFLADGTALEDAQVGITIEGSSPLLLNLKASTGSITMAPK